MENLMGTHWEHDGNKRKKKNIPSHPFQKEKNWTCHESIMSLALAAWNFYFENSLSPIWPGLMAWNSPKKEKRKNSPLPNPRPKRKKLGPSLMHVEPFNGCIATLVSKTVCHHFWPGLIALPKNTLPITRG
jgi:hypothetical protein